MTDASLLTLDATGQAERIRAGEVSSRELVEAAIARIESLNPVLNAVIHRRFDRALEEAQHPAPGVFSGVPFLLKDLDVALAGEPFHAGMVCLKKMGYRATLTSALVSRFQNAGLIILGKTNTPELGLHGTTEPRAWGATRNPWNPAHSTGGSSGGSAAAVAAGMTPMAHASDGGGSIRIPASACGLVGLKPSRGRISMAPEHGDYWNGFVCSFALTRSVRDAAALLDAVSGSEPGDPYSAPPQREAYVDVLEEANRPLRIGLMLRSPDGARDCHADCVAAVTQTGKTLEALGHHVEISHPPAMDQHRRVFAGFNRVVSAWVARSLDEWGRVLGRPVREGDVEPSTLALAARGRETGAADYLSVVADLQSWSREMAGWWAGGFDLLVTPTLASPPLTLGSRARDVFAIATFTTQFNITGQPAISLPLAAGTAGLPMGVQLVAAANREDVLFRVAAALERASPWSCQPDMGDGLNSMSDSKETP